LRLDIRPSFTTIHTNQEVTLANFTVPAIRTRQLDTAIELNVGETAVFAGLRQEERVEDGGIEESEIVFTIRAEYPFTEPAAR
jgi:Flp pilus assembly secretin CpaC